MKIIKTHKIWSSRIAKNLVRYGYAQDYKTVFNAMIDMIKSSDEITLQELRDLSASIASNASSRKRDSAASALVKELGLKKVKTEATKTKPKPTKSKNIKSADVIPLKSKRAQVLADLQKRDEIRALLKLLQG